MLLILGRAAGAVEQVHVRGRGPDRAANPFGGQLRAHEEQRIAIDQQVLRVAREPIAEGRRFGGLQVRVAHADEVGVALDLRGERAQAARRATRATARALGAAERSRPCPRRPSRSRPRWIFPPPTVACEAKTRISAIKSWPISRSIASAASMSIDSPCARKSSSSACVTRPLRTCDSASAIQTARQSGAVRRSEKSSRSSGRP